MQIMRSQYLTLLTMLCGILITSCTCKPDEKKEFPKTGSIERLSPLLDDIIEPGTLPEILAGGFTWSEGPLWIKELDMLIFSDIPVNTVFQWTEKDSISIYLNPSGLTSTEKRGGETGSNGLVFDPDGNLVLMDNDFDGDYDGLSLDAPEMLAVTDPAPGTWVVLIDGFTIWHKKEFYRFFADITRQPSLAKANKAFAIEGISSVQSLLPGDFGMEQNYPNPFNPTTTINYQLPKDAYVTLRVYDIQGRLVRSLVNEQKAAGFYASFWDGHNNAGQSVPSGTYIYQISAGDFRQTNKMMLLK